jgi:hypothetical protein
MEIPGFIEERKLALAARRHRLERFQKMSA